MKELFTYEEVPAKGFRQKFIYAVDSTIANFRILKEGKPVRNLTAWKREYVRHTVNILNAMCGKCKQ
jgi:hypothetical protein